MMTLEQKIAVDGIATKFFRLSVPSTAIGVVKSARRYPFGGRAKMANEEEYIDRNDPPIVPGGVEAAIAANADRRFGTVMIVLAVVVVATIWGVTSIINHEHGKEVGLLTGVTGILLFQLVSMARQEKSRQEAKLDRRVIARKVDILDQKTNGNLTKAIHEVAAEVKRAKDEPAPGQEAMPSNVAELNAMINRIAGELCDRLAEQAATRAAQAAAETAARTARDKVEEIQRQTVGLVADEMRRRGMIS